MFPVGDAWFYGLHVTKVYVSYGNMDDVRHAKSTQGVGQVQDMHGFVCSRGHPRGAYVAQCERFVQEMHGFVCSRDENSGFCNGKWAPAGRRVPIGPPGNFAFCTAICTIWRIQRVN